MLFRCRLVLFAVRLRRVRKRSSQVRGVTAGGRKNGPVDSTGSSLGGVIVRGVKRHKWLLFSGHTLQGPDFITATMAHNSLGSSQVDRLTRTAPVARLSTGPAAYSSRTEAVTVTRKDPDSRLHS